MIKVNGKEVVFESFPNGETLLKADSLPEKMTTIRGISFKYENDSDLIKLMLLKNFIDSKHCANFIPLTIYYMPYSRMDRTENGSPFTLKYVADFINGLGFKTVKIVEPHSDVTPALVNNSESVYVNFDLIEQVKKEVGFDDELDYLMFPDAGAGKRYSKMKNKNVIIGNKVRDFETGKITEMSLQSEFDSSSEKVIIVDDLSSYGGTFVMSAEALRKEGFKEIYLLVAHAENAIFKGELFNHMTKVFTTDTILDADHTLVSTKLKVYDIEEVLNKKGEIAND
jgi:ribose-phosphate pyrophosphokinase